MDVAHPSSENYGKHWTPEKVRETFAPSSNTVDAVRDWLVSSRISSNRVTQTMSKGWLEFNLPVREAEQLFSTKFYEHQDLTDGTVKIGCDQYFLPEHIAPHVDYVTPGVALSPPLLKRTVKRESVGDWIRKPFAGPSESESEPSPAPAPVANGAPYSNSTIPANLKNCGKRITPACIRALYGIPKATLSDAQNALGVFEFGDKYAQGSLNSFFTKYAPNVPNGTHPDLASIGRGSLTKAPVPVGKDGGESDIDFDMAFSLIYPQKVTLYQTASTPYNLSYLDTHSSLRSQGLTFGQAANNLLDALDGVSSNSIIPSLNFES